MKTEKEAPYFRVDLYVCRLVSWRENLEAAAVDRVTMNSKTLPRAVHAANSTGTLRWLSWMGDHTITIQLL